jgi:predicted flap endonuclease-1-like 5' DNA nuclease
MVKDSRFITNSAERGIAELREQQGISQTDSLRLTDVDGIGPQTAEKLEQAGIDKPVELSRVTPNQLEMVDGIGPRKADLLASQFQYSQTRFKNPDDADLEEARDDMADRNKVERRTDRSFNAPITFDYDTWSDDPDRWDMPGVDTVPEQRRAERTEKKAKRGGFNIEATQIRGRASGKATGDTARIDVSKSFDPVSSAAHEVGHLAENSMGGRNSVSSELFQDETVKEEAEQLAVRRRSMVTSSDSIEEAYHEDDYEAELFADAFAVATEEPRAAKREAPNLTRKMQDETLMDFGRF